MGSVPDGYWGLSPVVKKMEHAKLERAEERIKELEALLEKMHNNCEPFVVM